jgi:ribosome-associated translation inhibitor RaiA
VNKEVQEYAQKFSRYQLELNTVYTSWAKTESDSLQQYQADIQNQQAVFNKENAEYQAQLQISIQDAQLSSQDDGQKLTKYGSELQSYQSNVNTEIQDFVNTLNKESQEYQNKIALYNANLQKYQAESSEKSQKITSSVNNANFYSGESKKYYEWAKMEITSYIQNNSKMIGRTMAAQQQAAQQQAR